MSRIPRIRIIFPADTFNRTYFYIDLCDKAAKFYYERKGSHPSWSSAGFCIRRAGIQLMAASAYP